MKKRGRPFGQPGKNGINVSARIRSAISTIAVKDLPSYKPRDLFPMLGGIPITDSVRGSCSVILKKEKEKRFGVSSSSGITAVRNTRNANDLAMRLIESLNGDFEQAHKEISRLEEFIKKLSKPKPKPKRSVSVPVEG